MRATRALGLCAVLSLIGIGLAGYLTYLHFGLLRGELLGGAACSGTGTFNCHAVMGGAWGAVLGVPLSLWGILGYVAILALALWGQQSAESAVQAAGLVTVLASAFVGVLKPANLAAPMHPQVLPALLALRRQLRARLAAT